MPCKHIETVAIILFLTSVISAQPFLLNINANQLCHTNATLWATVFINTGRTLYSLLLNIHIEQLCYTLSASIKVPYFEQILILKDQQALNFILFLLFQVYLLVIKHYNTKQGVLNIVLTVFPFLVAMLFNIGITNV